VVGPVRQPPAEPEERDDAEPAEGNANGVFVQEWDGVLARDSYSSGFHLVVSC
jgi:hypothetical protein